MKTGINLLLWTGHVTREHAPLLEKIRATGFDGVELPMFDVASEVHYRLLGDMLDGLGLERTVTTAVQDPALSPISPDPAHRRAAADYLRRVIDCSAALGATMVAGPIFQALGVFTGKPPTDAELDRCAEVHASVAPAARAAGIVCAIEPLNRFEAHLLNTCQQAGDYMARLGEEGFGILYDTFHAHIEEKDPVAALRGLHSAGALAHVHISENDRGTPGKGQARIRETISALKAMGYDGWLTIEAFGGAVPELAAATRVWRDFFASPEEVYTEGYRYIMDCWENDDA